MQLHIIALSASKKYLRSTYWQRVFDIHWIFNFHSSQKIIYFLKSWRPTWFYGNCYLMEINAETQWRRLSSWAINYNIDHKHIWFPCVSFVYESLVNSFFCCFVVTLVTIILGLVMFWLKKYLSPRAQIATLLQANRQSGPRGPDRPRLRARASIAGAPVALNLPTWLVCKWTWPINFQESSLLLS